MEFDEIVVKESPGLCRCCLSEGCYKDMGTEYTWMNENEVYADMLLECFDIGISQHNDGPNGPNRLICEVCITRLRDACNFKKQVLDSEKKFVDMVGRGEFRPKVLIYQSQMKSEANEETAGEDAEVEYLEEIDFGDDDEPLKNEPSASEIAVEPLPVSKRGRPRKTLKAEKKKPKVDERPKTSKALVKEEDTNTEPEKALQRQLKVDMANLLETIITKTTAVPFRWHECKYMCFYCSEHFIESSKLRDHVESHADVDIHEILLRTVQKPQRVKLDVSELWCTVCTDKISSFEEYLKHIAECQNKEYDSEVVGRFEIFKLSDEDLNCLECGQNFAHFGQLLNHTHQSHVNAEKNHKFLCEICGQGFANKGSVDTHIRQIHCAQKCIYCSEAFQTRYALDKHVGAVHKSERLQCPVCSEVLPNRYQKKRHLAFVHDVKSVQMPCYVCNKVFVRNNKLLSHIRRVHLKEKNVSCEICGLYLFDAASLKKHVVCHGERTQFKCGICGKTFMRKKGLSMHIAQNHASD